MLIHHLPIVMWKDACSLTGHNHRVHDPARLTAKKAQIVLSRTGACFCEKEALWLAAEAISTSERVPEIKEAKER